MVVPSGTRQYSRAFSEIATVGCTDAGFSYWQSANGEILSTDALYRFGMPSGDYTLTAVCNATVPAATAALSDAFVDENGNLLLLLSQSVTEGTLVEYGVLMTRKATAADLTVDTEVSSVTRGYSSKATGAGVVAFRKTGMFEKQGTWLFRGYVTYADAQGELNTVYSGVYTATIADSAVRATPVN